MSEEVKMPQMGESIAEGTIVKWLKHVGDSVKRDEPLFEISTDKVDAEIPAPTSGVLSEIKVQEGETVPVNTVVAVINGAGSKPAAPQPAKEAPGPPKEEPAQAKAEPPPSPPPVAPPSVATPSPPAKTSAPPPPPTSAATATEELRQTRSSPVVRKIAEEHGIDISQIEGTGIGGRVTKQDILAFVENRKGEARPAAAPSVVAAAQPAPPR